jgi:predicted unusual protein kinase regulating ubiquinone biosynthesis (AarF/ABC1/UbiB family)
MDMLRARYFKILIFFLSILLTVLWWDIFIPRIGLRNISRRNRKQRMRKIAARFRVKAIQMGGVMIKVGQFLSARLDVLPREFTDELAGLQDEVQPEKFTDIRLVLEDELQTTISEKFEYFDETPIAAASIGQVHCARLHNEPGAEKLPMVVVKIQRPNIARIVETDLKALRVVGKWLMLYRPISRSANVPALIEEFTRTLYEEMDYVNEGKNAEKFAENFKDQENVRVPKVYWDFTTRRVLTLEDVQNIKITDYAAIDQAGIDRIEVADRLFNTYLKQIFEDRFFHADPHPGNLFIHPVPETEGVETIEWKLVFVDFGMAGQVTDNLYEGLRELIIGVGTRDSSRIIQAYQKMDVLLPSANVELIERATARMFERFWGKTTPEMMKMRREEAQKFLNEFGDLIYEMPFQIPENLILLGRTLGILSGMCTGLNPDFNIWTSIAPYATKLIGGEGGQNWQFWLKELANIVTILASLPKQTQTVLDRIQHGELVVQTPGLNREVIKLERVMRWMVAAIFFATFFLTSTQFYLHGDHLLAGGLLAAAFVVLLLVLFGK